MRGEGLFERFREPDRLPIALDYVAVWFVGAIIVFYLGGVTGSLKGDDAYLHLTKLRFLVEHFPHVFWDPRWYLGYDPFSKYPYFLYLVLGAVKVVTGLSYETVGRVGLFVTLSALPPSIYRLARQIEVPRSMGVFFALLFLTLPVSWNWSLFGGAYLRVFALPLVFVSIAASLDLVEQINENDYSLRTVYKNILLLAVTAVVHPLLWLFTFLTIGGVYLFGIRRSIRHRLVWGAGVFIPVGGLTAWFYLPYVFVSHYGAVGMTPLHNTDPIPFFSSLILSETTNLTFNPLFSVLFLGMCLTGIVSYFQYERAHFRERHALVLSAVVIGIYTAIMSWVHVPRSLYAISSFDYLFITAIFALIVMMGVCKDTFHVVFESRRQLVSLTLLLLLVLQSMVAFPAISSNSVSNVDPDNPETMTAAMRDPVAHAVNQTSEEYRLGVTHRRFIQWMSYSFPDTYITGGRLEASQPNKRYQDWYRDEVFYSDANINTLYWQDRPKLLPDYGYLADRTARSRQFLADWFASNGIILAPTLMNNPETVNQHLDRPYLYDTTSNETGIGPIYYARYPDTSPRVTASTTPTLAVATDESGDRYFRTLMVLSYVGADSTQVIPVRLHLSEISATQLSAYDRLLVTDSQFRSHREKIDRFARSGGTVIVTNDPQISPERSVENGIVRETERVGEGRVIRLGVTIDTLYASQRFEPAVAFGQLVAEDMAAERKKLSTQWQPSYTTVGTTARLDGGQNETVVTMNVNESIRHNQVNVHKQVMGGIPSDARGILTFRLKASNWNDTTIDIVLRNSSTTSEFLHQGVSTDGQGNTESGWRTYSLALSSFKLKGEYDPELKTIDTIEIVINRDPPYDGPTTTVKIDETSFLRYGLSGDPGLEEENETEEIGPYGIQLNDQYQSRPLDELQEPSSWEITYTELASGRVDRYGQWWNDSSPLRFRYTFTDAEGHHQVNYVNDPSGEWDWEKDEALSFRVFGNGQDTTMAILLERDTYKNAYSTSIRIDWEGWRTITIPMNAFDKRGNVSLDAIDKVEIDLTTEGRGDNVSQAILFDDFAIIEETHKSVDQRTQPTMPSIDRPTPQRMVITPPSQAEGIVVKESYEPGWTARITYENGTTHRAQVEFAGPGAMYIATANAGVESVSLVYRSGYHPIATIISILVGLLLIVVWGVRSPTIPIDDPTGSVIESSNVVENWDTHGIAIRELFVHNGTAIREWSVHARRFTNGVLSFAVSIWDGKIYPYVPDKSYFSWVQVLAIVGVLLFVVPTAVGAAFAPSISVPQGAAGESPSNGAMVVGVQGDPAPGRVVVVGRNNRIRWERRDADSYHSVVPLGNQKILTAPTLGNQRECGAYKPNCARTGVRMFSYRNDSILFNHLFPVRSFGDSEVHDVERLPNGDFLVADMDRERVFILHRNGTIAWQWNASTFYEAPPDPTKRDWLHINDVDRIEEGRYLISVRNANQLLVLNRTGDTARVTDVINQDTPGSSDGNCLQRGQLFDADDDADVRCGDPSLFRHQHNPQWLGENAVLVADSENDRIVELHRDSETGDWQVVWTVSSFGGLHLDWPRDADRLPNGHTLITDSRNNRVVEINETGAVVRSIHVQGLPYDADYVAQDEPVGGPTYDAGGQSVNSTQSPENVSRSDLPVISLLYASLTHVLPIPYWLSELYLIPYLMGVVCLLGSLGMTLRRKWQGLTWDI